MCIKNVECEVTDGISKYCYYTASMLTYLNSEGEILHSKCFTNKIEMTCGNNSEFNLSLGILK